MSLGLELHDGDLRSDASGDLSQPQESQFARNPNLIRRPLKPNMGKFSSFYIYPKHRVVEAVDLGFRSGFWPWLRVRALRCARYRAWLRLEALGFRALGALGGFWGFGLWVSDSGLRRVWSFGFRLSV